MQAPLPNSLARTGLVFCLFSFSACDLPTATPIFETRWIFPIEENSISVDEMLPAAVTTSGEEFEVAVDPFTFPESLGNLCLACLPFDGLVVPKPLLQFSFSDVSSYATDVESFELLTGSVTVRITNGLGFDPIRPGVGVTGSVTVTVYDEMIGGRELDRIVLNGAVDSLSNGTALDLPIDLTAGPVTSTVVAVVDMHSPLGDPVLINTTSQLDVDVTFGVIAVSSATVNVAGRQVALDEVAMDVEKIDSYIVDNILSGALILNLSNPFGVGLTATIDIKSPAIPTISKSLTITSNPTSQVRLEYTRAELRSFLGQMDVTIGGSGTVSTDAGSITVSPGQIVTMKGSLDAVVELGG